jgi:hypothetical protein
MKLEPVWGFRPNVARMDLSGPHTLRSPDSYLQDNLGQDTVEWLHQGKPAVIAVGEGRQQLDQLEQSGWKLGEPVSKAVGFHQVRQATTPEGKPVMLVWRVNGQDRTEHLQSLLRMAGAASEQVGTVGTTRSYKEEYLEKFRSLGEAPELVVYGMAKTAAASVLTAHPIRNFKPLLNLFRRRGAPEVDKSLSQSDMAGLRMEVMTLKDGKKVWFFPPLYGDLSKDLLDALLEHGAKKFNFVGTAGGVDPRLEVGQILSPTERLRDDGQREKLDWLIPTAGCHGGGTYQRVVTPNLETQAWAQRADAQDVDLVEVELGHWLDATKERPGVELRVQTVLSDVVQGPNHQDMTEWGTWDTLKVHKPVLKAIREALGGDPDLRLQDYFSTSMIP